MKKVLVVLVALAVWHASVAAPPQEERCRCGAQFVAQKNADGQTQCVGKQLLVILPCGLPQAPRCACDADAVDGILTDAEGTWCTRAKKKWPCENADEWAAYRVELDEYNRSRKH